MTQGQYCAHTRFPFRDPPYWWPHSAVRLRMVHADLDTASRDAGWHVQRRAARAAFTSRTRISVWLSGCQSLVSDRSFKPCLPWRRRQAVGAYPVLVFMGCATLSKKRIFFGELKKYIIWYHSCSGILHASEVKTKNCVGQEWEICMSGWLNRHSLLKLLCTKSACQFLALTMLAGSLFTRLLVFVGGRELSRIPCGKVVGVKDKNT